jgi:hypothetical protein
MVCVRHTHAVNMRVGVCACVCVCVCVCVWCECVCVFVCGWGGGGVAMPARACTRNRMPYFRKYGTNNNKHTHAHDNHARTLQVQRNGEREGGGTQGRRRVCSVVPRAHHTSRCRKTTGRVHVRQLTSIIGRQRRQCEYCSHLLTFASLGCEWRNEELATSTPWHCV